MRQGTLKLIMFTGFRSIIFARQIRRYLTTQRLNMFLVKEITKELDYQAVPDEVAKMM
ncbi:MAG: hypothetical protein U9N19_09740 [Thermodesulfobacteriota bacterium]|nr:hypothetical protein [Thermodesulfobacteriota bacterium]